MHQFLKPTTKMKEGFYPATLNNSVNGVNANRLVQEFDLAIAYCHTANLMLIMIHKLLSCHVGRCTDGSGVMKWEIIGIDGKTEHCGRCLFNLCTLREMTTTNN